MHFIWCSINLLITYCTPISPLITTLYFIATYQELVIGIYSVTYGISILNVSIPHNGHSLGLTLHPDSILHEEGTLSDIHAVKTNVLTVHPGVILHDYGNSSYSCSMDQGVEKVKIINN